VDEVGVVPVLAAQRPRIRRGGHDAAHHEAVLAEAAHDALQLALEVERASGDQHAVDGGRGDGGQRRQRGLARVLQPRSCGQADLDELVRAREAHGELPGRLGVALGGVARAADEAEVVLPAHRHRHVLGRDVVALLALPSGHQDQRGGDEDARPDRLVQRNRDYARE
jgi:hypothetical protein